MLIKKISIIILLFISVNIFPSEFRYKYLLDKPLSDAYVSSDEEDSLGVLKRRKDRELSSSEILKLLEQRKRNQKPRGGNSLSDIKVIVTRQSHRKSSGWIDGASRFASGPVTHFDGTDSDGEVYNQMHASSDSMNIVDES